MNSKIRHVTSLISNNPGRGKSVQHLAETVGLSASRLRHLFKEETGMTVAQYRRLKQLEKARKLLEESAQFQVKQVRLMVGWLDASRFSRDFKAAYGETPRECRERYLRASYQTEMQS